MAWLWRGGAEGVGEESVAADHREENAAAMATMRELCKDLLDPDTHGASESAPANARSDDDGEREIVPASKLEIPEEATLQRFVTGYELDAHVAAKRLRKMLKWRVSHSYGLEDTLVRDISESTPGVQHQIETGKCYILAQRDTKGRPIIVVHVRRHDPNTQTKDELSRFGVHILESAERLLREPAVDTGAGAAELSSGVPGAGDSEEALEPDKLLIIFNLVSHARCPILRALVTTLLVAKPCSMPCCRDRGFKYRSNRVLRSDIPSEVARERMRPWPPAALVGAAADVRACGHVCARCDLTRDEKMQRLSASLPAPSALLPGRSPQSI